MASLIIDHRDLEESLSPNPSHRDRDDGRAAEDKSDLDLTSLTLTNPKCLENLGWSRCNLEAKCPPGYVKMRYVDGSSSCFKISISNNTSYELTLKGCLDESISPHSLGYCETYEPQADVDGQMLNLDFALIKSSKLPGSITVHALLSN